jgi:hypothetical protein
MVFADYALDHKKKFWPCPTCTTPIEKDSGCNHMTCPKCKKHFCWTCKKTLGDNYQKHFTDALGNDGRLAYESQSREEFNELNEALKVLGVDNLIPSSGCRMDLYGSVN